MKNQIITKRLKDLADLLKKESSANDIYQERDLDELEAILNREYSQYHWSKYVWVSPVKSEDVETIFTNPKETLLFTMHLLKKIHSFVFDEELENLLNEKDGYKTKSKSDWVINHDEAVVKEERDYYNRLFKTQPPMTEEEIERERQRYNNLSKEEQHEDWMMPMFPKCYPKKDL